MNLFELLKSYDEKSEMPAILERVPKPKTTPSRPPSQGPEADRDSKNGGHWRSSISRLFLMFPSSHPPPPYTLPFKARSMNNIHYLSRSWLTFARSLYDRRRTKSLHQSYIYAPMRHFGTQNCHTIGIIDVTDFRTATIPLNLLPTNTRLLSLILLHLLFFATAFASA